MTTPTRPLVLGIDPDVEKPGVAVYDAARGHLLRATSTPLREVSAWLREGARTDWGRFVLLCIEDTRELPLYKARRGRAPSAAARDAMARTIGRLDHVTEQLIADAREGGLAVRSCQPVRKLDAPMFKRLTGWDARTNQEARDAGMLCWGVEPARIDIDALRCNASL